MSTLQIQAGGLTLLAAEVAAGRRPQFWSVRRLPAFLKLSLLQTAVVLAALAILAGLLAGIYSWRSADATSITTLPVLAIYLPIIQMLRFGCCANGPNFPTPRNWLSGSGYYLAGKTSPRWARPIRAQGELTQVIAADGTQGTNAKKR